MKYRHIILVFLLAVTTITNAQREKIIGNWLITKIEVNGKIENNYAITQFKDDGKMLIMGIEIGTWDYQKSNNAIVLISDFDKDFNGENKILKLSNTELVVLKDEIKVFYKKIDFNQIIAQNANSGLIGTWKLINNNSDSVQILDFKASDEFVLINKDNSLQSTSKGTWIFNEKDKTVILIGFSLEYLKGLNKVTNITTDKISLENNNIIYSFRKEENQASKIQKLTFSEEEFYDETGDYKYYDDVQKLPWNNWSGMKTELLNVKQLVYNFATLINGTTAFKNKILTANVNANVEEEGFSIDNVFIGFDSYNVPEDTEFYSHKFDSYSKLYPLDENTFRVKGQETITTPAGTFNCTIVEAINGDTRKKLWMINDKIGVYAKIIEEDPDENFGHYYIYELKEIK